MLGIDSKHLPETTPIVDTLRAIILLSILEGYKVNFVKHMPISVEPNPDIYHIGAVHFNKKTDKLTFFRGSYFWRLCLDYCSDTNLQNYYWYRYGRLSASDILKMRPDFAEFTSTKVFMEFVEDIAKG